MFIFLNLYGSSAIFLFSRNRYCDISVLCKYHFPWYLFYHYVSRIFYMLKLFRLYRSYIIVMLMQCVQSQVHYAYCLFMQSEAIIDFVKLWKTLFYPTATIKFPLILVWIIENVKLWKHFACTWRICKNKTYLLGCGFQCGKTTSCLFVLGQVWCFKKAIILICES